MNKKGAPLDLTRLLGLALVLFIVSLVPRAQAQSPERQLTLQLKWRHQFQFAGYYVALERGYYRERGLSVRILEATPTTNVVEDVIHGRADVGVGTTELLLDRAKGEPVVVLAVVFQHSPLAIAVRTDRGISHLHQLIGKRLMLEPGAAELRALLALEHIDSSKLTILPHSFRVEDLAEGQIDAASVYSTDEPFLLRQANIPFLLLNAREASVDFYGDNLFTSERALEQNPADLKAFRDASMKGWQEALANPEAAIDLILQKYHTVKTRDHLRFEAEQTKALIMPGVVELGYMYTGRWQHIASTYAGLGLLPPNFDLQHVLYQPELPTRTPPWLWRTLGVAGLITLIILSFSVALLQLTRRLHRSRAKLRGLLDSSPTPMLVIDLGSGEIAYLNSRAGSALGRNPNEKRFPAENLYANPTQRAELLRKVRSSGFANYELELRKSDGSTFWVLVTSTISEFEDKPALISGFIDLTERKKLEDELRKASEEILTLQGILPICMFCKRIRTDAGAWQQVERYVSERTAAKFSHGMCPQCLVQHYPEFDEPSEG